jgi:phage head maturation protease
MRETADGLLVRGRLDLQGSETAKAAWRAMREDSMSLSFGFVAGKRHDEGDVTVLDQIDLFEVSIVPAPANDRTRVVSMKAAFAAPAEDPVPTLAQIRAQAKASAREQSRTRLVRAAGPIQVRTFEV